MRRFSLLIPVLALGLAGATTSVGAVAAPAAQHARTLTSLTAPRAAGDMGRGIAKTAGAISNSCSIRNGLLLNTEAIAASRSSIFARWAAMLNSATLRPMYQTVAPPESLSTLMVH